MHRIRNWDKYQHYKHRNPPWIKLHYELLTSPDWVCLDDTSRTLLVSCLLVASRRDGEVDCSEGGAEYMQRVAYLPAMPDFTPLIACGFLEEVRTNASKCTHQRTNALPETETELELKKELKTPPTPSRGQEVSVVDLIGDAPLNLCERYDASFSLTIPTVLALWKTCRTAANLGYAKDQNTKEGAALLAAMIDDPNQAVSERQVEAAMRKLCADRERGTWGLKGLARNLGTFLRPEKRRRTEVKRVVFDARCECGHSEVAFRKSGSNPLGNCPVCKKPMDFKENTG